ncbi:hypothetical protein B0T22DRAFT_474033 [Podospora appendiculata]|uniref:Uncharacterized protein n=1 Tax=Podospora appendiculata TaxID=314037 RepID=A0AAE1C793_9PEZI|nr:hypothetical protein B0T22DRAFT_474033 [Podospora appendiculata]
MLNTSVSDSLKVCNLRSAATSLVFLAIHLHDRWSSSVSRRKDRVSGKTSSRCEKATTPSPTTAASWCAASRCFRYMYDGDSERRHSSSAVRSCLTTRPTSTTSAKMRTTVRLPGPSWVTPMDSTRSSAAVSSTRSRPANAAGRLSGSTRMFALDGDSVWLASARRECKQRERNWQLRTEAGGVSSECQLQLHFSRPDQALAATRQGIIGRRCT